ncbi:MAG TPA: TRAP transporter small permease subunit [Geminicoccaceae bacterium]|nr:TRAP transporter small permease subunit [Geminicoccaceae bacterium]
MAAAASKPAASRILMVADGIDWVVGVVCRTIVLVTVTVLLVVLGANVVARYALAQGGISGISEVPEQLFPWLIAAGIVLAVQHGAHIAVDLLLVSLGRNGRRLLIVFINVLVAVAYLVLLRVNLQVAAIAAAELSPILQLPRSLGYYALSFGTGLTALCSLTVALRVAVLGPEAAPQPNPEESVT